MPGWSIDLSEPDPITGRKYDLRDRGDQQRVLNLLERDRPYMVMLSPPCTIFSHLLNLNPAKGSAEWRAKYNESMELLRFSMKIARRQHRSGRYFAFEHPDRASSWWESTVADIWNLPGVERVYLDMCAFGLKTTTADGRVASARKATQILTNMPAMIYGLPR